MWDVGTRRIHSTPRCRRWRTVKVLLLAEGRVLKLRPRPYFFAAQPIYTLWRSHFASCEFAAPQNRVGRAKKMQKNKEGEGAVGWEGTKVQLPVLRRICCNASVVSIESDTPLRVYLSGRWFRSFRVD